MKKWLYPALLIAGSLGLLVNVAACGDEKAEEEAQVEPFEFTVQLNESTVGAIIGLDFQFGSLESIHPALDRTTVVNIGSPISITFSALGGVALGSLSFGSCDVTIQTSTVPGLPNGPSFRINPCEMNIQTLNRLNVGTAGIGFVQLVLGGADSAGRIVNIEVTFNGVVFVNGTQVGVITDQGTVTGTTGSGG